MKTKEAINARRPIKHYDPIHQMTNEEDGALITNLICGFLSVNFASKERQVTKREL